jgi:DDE_Tnp_1-associated
MMRLKDALMEGLSDWRGLQGRYHTVWGVVLLVILGKMCGEQGVAGIKRFGRQLTERQKEMLGFVRHDTPCESTIGDILRNLNIEELQGVFRRVMVDGKEIKHLSIDGKTMRGSRSGDTLATHCVSAFCGALSATIGQTGSAGKGMEILDALRLLETLDLQGVIVTGDAMFTQVSIANMIVDKGGDYIFP